MIVLPLYVRDDLSTYAFLSVCVMCVSVEPGGQGQPLQSGMGGRNRVGGVLQNKISELELRSVSSVLH